MLFLDVNKVWCVSSIECFHSRGQHLCKFIRTKKSVCIRKEFNSQRIGLKKPTWPPFHCFGTPIWPPWRHVKTPYRPFQHVPFVFPMYVIFKYYLNIIEILFLNIIKIILRELSHSKFHLIPVHMKRQRGKFPWDLTFIGKTAKQLEGPSQWVGWGGYSLWWPIRGGSTQKGYPLHASGKKCKRLSLPYETFLSTHPPPPGSWLCRGLTNPLMICSLSRGFLTRYYRTWRAWFLVGLIIRFVTLTLGTLRSEDSDGSFA